MRSIAPYSFVILLVIFSACAHGEQAKRETRPAVTQAPSPAPVTSAARVVNIDADADGLTDADDPCPLEPGESGCPTEFGYFFLRVVNTNRVPVNATLAFQPVVNRVVTQDDGYAGTLRPGVYHVRAEAPGFAAAEMMFEVAANQKALVEITLLPEAGELP